MRQGVFVGKPEQALKRSYACPKKRKKHINSDVEFGEGEGQVSLEKLQEELKRPRSHSTAEMVEAIKDALKYFEII